VMRTGGADEFGELIVIVPVARAFGSNVGFTVTVSVPSGST